MNVRLAALAALALPVLGCGDGKMTSSYIALQSDFAAFRTWPRYFVGDGPLEGHPAGPRYGYLKQKTGDKQYPVGSLIVKTVERGTTPQDWDVFAMAKRGAGFNSGGAAGWEFFVLRINADDVPVIFSRGTNPFDAPPDGGGAGHGYSDPSGSGITCNRCHGIPGTERNDHILSVPLAPGAQ